MKPSAQQWTVAACAVVVLAVVVRLAWVSDDAFITLRTVENWYAGHGPVWNVADRVQTYTHPLWMLLLAAARGVLGEAYSAALWLGFGCTAAAVVVLLRALGPARAVVAVTTVLLAARSFAEYSTGGLENALAHLLLALLMAPVLRGTAPRVLPTALLAGLLATTRYDLALLAGPLVLAALRARGWRRSWPLALLGGVPFAAWFLFAAWWYGSPFPITAYAKAFAHGVPAGDLLLQGLRYLGWLCLREPATIVTVAAGIGLGLGRPDLRCRAPAAGALLYVVYVVKVGGDFMAGRLLTPVLFVCAAIVGRWLGTCGPRAAAAVGAGALALLFATGVPAWLRSPAAERAALAAAPARLTNGVLDERSNYWPDLGLFSPTRSVPRPAVFTAVMQANGRERPMVMVWGQVGRFGYEAGPAVHLVDRWLCDPLLMRLPIAGDWRIGHFQRRVPDGWLQTVATGVNRLRDPDLAHYWDVLGAVIAPVPSPATGRLARLWSLWTGAETRAVGRYAEGAYRHPVRRAVALAELGAPPAPNTLWFDHAPAVTVGDGGVAVTLPEPARATTLRVSLQPPVRYRITLRRGDGAVGAFEVDANDPLRWRDGAAVLARYQPIRAQAPAFFDSIHGGPLLLGCCLGLQQVDVPVPDECGPFDAVWIDTVGDFPFAVAACGGVELLR
ncbi:MAG: hypothetical protein AB7O97_11385 [Planctomycetota bacterium]